ncbi:MAG: GH3 auxin-responsive promoter family protein [Bacteroidetes bacterium]|nr:GH3 auxin-responsive promoter family protein [Bacteroidota bacterium]
MSILNNIIELGFTYRLRAIENIRKNPIETQNKVFKKLMNSLSLTVYGNERNVKNNFTYSDFRKHIPIVTYEDIEPYIKKMRMGESNILWDKPVNWFAKSSGTTNNKSKYIPVTNQGLQKCHFMGGRDLIALTASLYPETNLFKGKALTLGGSHNIEQLSHGDIRCGDLSAVMINNTPSFYSLIRLPKKETALISDFNLKIESICEQCIDQNITTIAGVPSWNLVMLNKILEYTGKKDISEIWPNLEMFYHGGVAFTPYREEYKRIITSPNMKYTETYNASEGFFAIQDDPKDKSMLLMLDYGVFYEFIPVDTLENYDSAIPLEEVKKDVNYAMVISTINGLWRYLIGDTVKFTSTDPYKIIITGRTKLFMNAFGEEIIIDNAENAIDKACEVSNSSVFEYTSAPIFMHDKVKGRHQWVVEFRKEPEDINLFIDTLDDTLKKLNSDYEAKRTDDTTLLRPQVNVVPEGTFMKWLESKGKTGGQNKIPRLSNSRDYVEELLKL